MSEKQLNFLNIFEPSKHEIENIDEDVIENEEEQSTDTETQGTEEKKEDLISDALIKREEEIKKEAEIKLKRLYLLQSSDDDIELSEFDDIMPEIKSYEVRMAMFRAEYEAAQPGKDKEKIYNKLVNPDVLDEDTYRDSASLYLKYLRILRQDEKNKIVALRIKETQEKEERRRKRKEAEARRNQKNKSKTWKNGSGRDRAVEKFE
ncbi:hypothetical protein JXE04_03415 [Patescibacteria group bacterium]|nr:hypothetical protein [Patescibacteria group bacterium]